MDEDLFWAFYENIPDPRMKALWKQLYPQFESGIEMDEFEFKGTGIKLSEAGSLLLRKCWIHDAARRKFIEAEWGGGECDLMEYARAFTISTFDYNIRVMAETQGFMDRSKTLALLSNDEIGYVVKKGE